MGGGGSEISIVAESSIYIIAYKFRLIIFNYSISVNSYISFFLSCIVFFPFLPPRAIDGIYLF